MSEVKRFRSDWRHVVETEFDDSQYVLVSDCDAAIARLELLSGYDEAKERELFGKFYCEYYGVGGSVSIKDGLNIWLACAKSRARSAE